MLTEQNGLCAVGCGRIATTIEHDHSSGVVRGLTCTKCNIAMGLLGDDPNQLQACSDFLKKGGKQT
jgi:hypothetical protein